MIVSLSSLHSGPSTAQSHLLCCLCLQDRPAADVSRILPLVSRLALGDDAGVMADRSVRSSAFQVAKLAGRFPVSPVVILLAGT